MPHREREDEERPLLSEERQQSNNENDDEPLEVSFSEDEDDNPKKWSNRKRLTNVFIIALMAILSPLASSMFTPGISQIAKDLNSSEEEIIATTTGFVIFLGIGPLVLAPLSETFGRRIVYIASFTVFTLLQIPTALAPNAPALIVIRTISGFFGSVGIANGGGTINDMYEPNERAGVFGWYLLGPLLGKFLPNVPKSIAINISRADIGTALWRHHCYPTELEMDILDTYHRLRSQYHHWLLLPPRDVCSRVAREKTNQVA